MDLAKDARSRETDPITVAFQFRTKVDFHEMVELVQIDMTEMDRVPWTIMVPLAENGTALDLEVLEMDPVGKRAEALGMDPETMDGATGRNHLRHAVILDHLVVTDHHLTAATRMDLHPLEGSGTIVTDHCPFGTTLALELGVGATDHHHHCGANMTLARDETVPHGAITALVQAVVADIGATLTTVATCPHHHTGDRIAMTSEMVAARIIDDRITRAAGITIGASATNTNIS
jgi:hypothetical protein